MSETNRLTFQADLGDTDATIMVAFAGFTVLVWDHLITLADEVELIWKRDKSLFVYLFLLNRYLTPLGFIVNLVAFTLPSWGIEHFVRYEGAMTVIGIQIAGFIMFLRIRALYRRQKAVIWGIILLFFIWLGVNAWLLANGEPVPHAMGIHSCAMIFKASLSDVASASAWLPLLYDTCIFVLTLYKTICNLRSGYIVRTLLSDGILYYSVICMVNIVLTIMIVRAPVGTKNIAAQLELLLTVAMVSRITLNLKKQASEDTVIVVSGDWTASNAVRTMRKRSRSKTTGTRLRANTGGTTATRRDSISFQIEPMSFAEYTSLSTIYSIDLMPRATVNPRTTDVANGEEWPRCSRPRVKEEVEVV